MKTTTLSDFRAELLATGGYETKAENRPAERVRPGALTTLRYAWDVVRVFPWSGLYEMLGKLSTQSWAELCFTSVTGAEALGMKVTGRVAQPRRMQGPRHVPLQSHVDG